MATQTTGNSEGHGGIYAILIIIVILILAAVLYMSGAFGGGAGDETLDADIDIEAPEVPGGEGGE